MTGVRRPLTATEKGRHEVDREEPGYLRTGLHAVGRKSRVATLIGDRAALLIALVPTLALGWLGYQRRWMAEDAFISMRVIDNLLAGHGPVFNPGERVEAYTHPLWVAIVAVFGVAGIPLDRTMVFLGLALSLAGVFGAQVAAVRLWSWNETRTTPPGLSLPLPLGAIAFVAVPVVWDFTTSGLETGLIFAWLGLTYWSLVRCCLSDSLSRFARLPLVLTSIAIGVGPLVRPDLAIFSVAFLGSLLWYTYRSLPRLLSTNTLVIFAASASLPLAYQIFRMGYFAALVPNTALAKEASASRWSQGWAYLTDFTMTYHLWVPLAVVFVWIAGLMHRQAGDGGASVRILAAAPVIAAVIHLAYIARVGGDFMHGRMLLPSWFGMLLPVAMVPIVLRQRSAIQNLLTVSMVALVVWALAAGLVLRVPYAEHIGSDGIADERGVYADNAGHPNPTTLDAYLGMRQSWPRDGQAWKQRADAEARVLIIGDREYLLGDEAPEHADVVARAHNIGLSGVAAGDRVHIVDANGLADPIASRLELNQRGRPGHEKSLPDPWVIARFASPEAQAADPAVSAARVALGCGPLLELQQAVTESLSVGRFVANLELSWRLHDLRVPADPVEAATTFCSPSEPS